ncbi:MAG: exosortase O [Cyanobacteria bacterium J06621_8]
MVNKSISKRQDYLQALVLIAAWLLGNAWTYLWFLESLSKTSLLNLILLSLGALFLIGRLITTKVINEQLFAFRWRLLPGILLLASEIVAVTLKWTLNIPQLTLCCFIWGSYGLLGLLINHETWKRGLSLALITGIILPFLVAFNSGLGFPVRVLTAHAVAQALTDFHLSAASSHDIIVMENGIAQVDLPCSGMKSLWTGTVFLLGATCLESRQLGWRWLLVAIANLIFLVAANVIRVLILVVIIEVLQQPQIADILHLPLGIVGFIIACGLSWLLLQKISRYEQPLAAIQPEKNYYAKSNFNWLLVLVISLGFIGQFQPFSTQNVALQSINLPATITTETLPLTPAEANFFDNPANPLVQKVRFNSNNLSGSMLIVASNTWQAHHPPELCFTGNGLKVDQMESRQLNPEINARWISLQNGELSAAYWFQSPQTTTDDFIARIWEHITQREQTWVLVSVLFDAAKNPQSPEINNFSQNVYQAIAQNLNPDKNKSNNPASS